MKGNIDQNIKIKLLSKSIEEMGSNNKQITNKNIKQQDEIKSLSKTIEEMKNNNKDITDKNIKQQDEIKSLSKTIEEMKNNNKHITAQYNIDVINFSINQHLNNMNEFFRKNKIQFIYNNQNAKNNVYLKYQNTRIIEGYSYSTSTITKTLKENNINLFKIMKKNIIEQSKTISSKLDCIYYNITPIQKAFTDKIEDDIEYFTQQKPYLNKLLENLQFWNNTNTEKDNPMLEYRNYITSYVNNYLDPIIQELSEAKKIPNNIKLDESILKINKYKENIKLELQNMLDNINMNYDNSINILDELYNKIQNIHEQESNVERIIKSIQTFTNDNNREKLFKQKKISKKEEVEEMQAFTNDNNREKLFKQKK